MNRSTQILFGTVAAIVLAGGGFFAGTLVASGRTPADTPAAQASPSGGARGGGGGALVRGGGQGAGGFGQAVSGRVIAVNADSITVAVRQAGQPQDTTSTIALVGPSTRLVRTTETDIKLADIKANDQVTILGTPDQATGAVSAQAIVVGGNALQQLFGGGAQGGARGSASPSPAR